METIYVFNLLFIDPINLLTLNLARSDELHYFIKVTCVLFLIFSIVVNLIFNSFTSSVNNEINKYYKIFHRFYAKNHKLLDTKRKFKIINSIERCGDRRHQIGFSCGDQFVITHKTSFKMWIIFLRYFMLSQKLSIN